MVATSYKQLWRGAAILSIAAIFIKVLSAAYRIPYQNITGDTGFYIYQQIYPLIAINLVVATYGFPVILSKLIAEQQKEKENALAIIFPFLMGLLIVSASLFTITFFGASILSNLMGDKGLTVPIKAASFSFLLVPVISVLRGYFQGNQNMIPTAVSQVGEQAVRVSFILVTSYLLIKNGYSVYHAGAAAVFGSVIGGIISFFVLWRYWLKDKIMLPSLKVLSEIRYKKMFRVFLQGIAICATSLFLIGIQFIDALTVYNGLIQTGWKEAAAKMEKGIFDRGYPLIQLGVVLATSLSMAIVPFIAKGKQKRISENSSLVFKIMVLVGMGGTVGLMLIAKPVNKMLFKSYDGTETIIILALSILFSSILMTTSSLLQGMGYIRRPAMYVGIGILIKGIFNPIGIWLLGTSGAAVVTVLAIVIPCLLTMRYAEQKLDIKIPYFRCIHLVIPITAMVAVIGCLHILFANVGSAGRAMATAEALASVILGGLIFVGMSWRSSYFTTKEKRQLAIKYNVKGGVM